MPVKALERSQLNENQDTTAIELNISQINSILPSPAGAGNKSMFVYEEINGIVYRAIAIEGNESLEMKLSTLGSQAHWRLEEHGLQSQFNAPASHLYHEGMKIIVNSSSGAGHLLFNVKGDTTEAQRLQNPTLESPPLPTAYTPWVIET